MLRSASAATYCAYVNDISSAANAAEAERIGTASPFNAIPAKAGTQVMVDTANTVTIQCSGVKLKLIPVTSSDAAFKPLKDKPGYVPPESIKLPSS